MHLSIVLPKSYLSLIECKYDMQNRCWTPIRIRHVWVPNSWFAALCYNLIFSDFSKCFPHSEYLPIIEFRTNNTPMPNLPSWELSNPLTLKSISKLWSITSKMWGWKRRRGASQFLPRTVYLSLGSGICHLREILLTEAPFLFIHVVSIVLIPPHRTSSPLALLPMKPPSN